MMSSRPQSPTPGNGQADECVTLVATASLPTRYGTFTSYAFRVSGSDAEHLALVMGDVAGEQSVLTRLHSECLTGDVFGSYRCDCGEQLDLALRYIAAEDRGVLLYLRGHEGRGIGLSNKIRAYALQEQGRDTVEANLDLGLPDDAREYDSAAAILRILGVTSVRLMSNNPAKFDTLAKHGIPVCERVALAVPVRGKRALYPHEADEVWALLRKTSNRRGCTGARFSSSVPGSSPAKATVFISPHPFRVQVCDGARVTPPERSIAPMSTPSKLETKRLTLRRWRPTDAGALSAMHEDPDVTAWLARGPMSVDEASDVIARASTRISRHTVSARGPSSAVPTRC